jgi:hypothetical protein
LDIFLQSVEDLCPMGITDAGRLKAHRRVFAQLRDGAFSADSWKALPKVVRKAAIKSRCSRTAFPHFAVC